MLSNCTILRFNVVWILLCLLPMSIHASMMDSYEFSLDTSSYYGTSVYFEIDLIDGASTPAEVAFKAPEVDGVSIGTDDSIADSSFFNFMEYPVTLSNELSFSFSLVTGEAPGASFFPDSFSLFLLDDSYMPLFGTSDPTGADSLLQWDIGVMEPIAFAGIVNHRDSDGPHVVSEPSHLGLLLVPLILLLRRKLWPLLVTFTFTFTATLPALANAEEPGVTDHTAEVEISQSGLRFNRQSRTFDSVITITNIVERDLSGELILATYDLPNGVLLTNASYVLPDGAPYIALAPVSEISAKSSTQVVLKFINRTNSAFATNFRFLALQAPLSDEALLLGPDADSNGVRDDLEPLIDSRYEDPEHLAAAQQVLAAIRESLTESGSQESSFDAVLNFNKSLDCLYDQLEIDEAASESRFLRDASLNTRERVVAWIMLSNGVAGQSLPINFPQPCNF